MLKNIKKDSTLVKYNGKIITLKPGESVDVRNFDVANKDVLAVEKHLMTKHPGAFEQEKTIGISKADDETQKEVEQLRKDNAGLSKDIEKLRAVNAQLTEKVDASGGEKQALKDTANSLKAETDAAVSKFKDMEDEIQKLREALATGKSARKK